MPNAEEVRVWTPVMKLSYNVGIAAIENNGVPWNIKKMSKVEFGRASHRQLHPLPGGVDGGGCDDC